MWSKGSVHVIKRVCSCDQKGLFMWSKGSVHVIKRDCSCDQKGLFMWSKGSVYVIKRVCSCDQKGLLCDQKGLFMWSKGSVHVIKRVCSCDQKGLFMWSKGSVHVIKRACSCDQKGLFIQTKLNIGLSAIWGLWKTHECMFIQISRETMQLLINNLHKNIRDNQSWTWPSVEIFPAIGSYELPPNNTYFAINRIYVTFIAFIFRPRITLGDSC
jgi:hypothetical protein